MKKVLLCFVVLFFCACIGEDKKNSTKEIQTENIPMEQSDSNVQINDETLPLPVDDEVKDENITQGQ